MMHTYKSFAYLTTRVLNWSARVVLWLLVMAVLPAMAASEPRIFASHTPSSPAPSLATILTAEGSLRPGATGVFNARRFIMHTAPSGQPIFRPAGVGDERWQDDFGLPSGPNGRVLAVIQAGTDLFIGGDFTSVNGVAANHIARWDGTRWSALGTGTANGVSNTVFSLAAAANGDVYVGGAFTSAGGLPSYRVARWNGTRWSSLGGPTTINTYASALAIASNGDVYAGFFTTLPQGRAAGSVARWNGSEWNAVSASPGTGMNNPVVSLAIAGNNDVYAGGYFSITDGKTTRNVAHWNGSTWEPLGNGTNSDVDAMAVAPNGDLLVGGRFTMAGVVAANRVARWNGTTWSSLGTGLANGVNNFVYALTVGQNGHVYVGGLFLQAGGIPAKRLARWDGTTWSSMGAGTGDGADDVVMALRASSDGSVYAVGNFTQAGRVVALNVARWTGNSWQALRTGGVVKQIG